MNQRSNEHGQPIGGSVPGWTPRARPGRETMQGRFCRVEALSAETHAESLFRAYQLDPDGVLWTYVPMGPFDALGDFRNWIDAASRDESQPYFAIVDQATGEARGIACYLRLQPEHGVIEVGGIVFSPLLQRKPAATEAMFLMMRHVMGELGYRRYEWKCDALNAPSRRAAERLGFTYDGLFEQAIVYKGRNRDTAWFSIIDKDWPALERAYTAWLDPANFDETGKQRRELGSLIAEFRER
ncbi:GNAT family N-acetyltransferase [Hoeflea poritis]|uniref:GNAT family protein n=1 Tax=Hoeflea poritis TaxID=2993659 RepID=A0ABT4VSN5_9HYPH|nr:GNAT family protein [Hoeflea poritis]MDA4847614.1 GNAT family protein [Hoeflea poritis]